MKTHSKFSVVKQNIAALDALGKHNQLMAKRKQLCWKCQKDKPQKGAKIRFYGTLKSFVCADCVTEKKAKTNATTS